MPILSHKKIATKTFSNILVFLVPDKKQQFCWMIITFFRFSTSSEKESVLPLQSTPTVLFDKSYYKIIYEFILAMWFRLIDGLKMQKWFNKLTKLSGKYAAFR